MPASTTESRPSDASPTPQPGIFERVEGIGRSSQRWGPSAGSLLTLLLHASFALAAYSQLFAMSGFTHLVLAHVDARLAATIDVEHLEEEPTPEPEPEPEETPEEELPKAEEPPLPLPESAEAPIDSTETPPPAAAEAGKILTREPDPDEPLDLTGEGFISGEGTRFAGGITARSGTSDKAVRNLAARGGGVKGSKGTITSAKPAAAATKVDKSRPAAVPRRANWNSCGFPAEATAEQINQAAVRVVVVVGKNGRPLSANVLSSPGFGFAAHTRRCAMRFNYPPGLDKNGNPTTTSTKPFMVKFTR